ncbi:hypothetical protein CC86DRAFT_467446 [Ophiobolus disseminans]|uniref:Extracellular membrane protein CFEM domain-containing protein n=1 Tax=Ophiobolus disseminans TaxID=1469910 RepID=A0A6A6ZXP5_9PLEO|nr:hypothetical protein CC86DRAFT_467446 [Ophiobolus disseminans]
MLLSHFKRLCVLSATLIAASPLATVVSTPTSLPIALQQGVPSCAQSCLQASLVEKFPVACTSEEGIQCLCSRYSNNGESLGEVAVRCVYSSCPTAEKGAAAAYNVCLGQRDAVIPTKTALTVFATNAPRTSSTSSSSSSRSLATPTITSTLQSQATPTPSVIVDSISDTPSATSSPSSSFTATAAVAADEPRGMTPAQIAGLSVAAVAAFVIAVGLMALSVCLRRRRERKNDFDSDEKGSSRKSKKYSPRISKYVAVGSVPGPPKQFPMAPLPVARQGGKAFNGPSAALYPTRPVQRNGVGTSNNSSDTSISLSQIGVAISAELDGNSAPPRTTTNATFRPQQPKNGPSLLNVPNRPFSTMTQDTVFEEDDTTAQWRSSVLLPTPPVPIPPIRSLQPSKRAATFDTATGFPIPPKQNPKQAARRSELFLNIPVRHERPQPKRIIAAQMPSTGSSQPPPPAQSNRLAPPIRLDSSSSPQATPGSSNPGDIDDYYFSSHEDSTPRASPAPPPRSRNAPKTTVQVRPKRSGSTVSRAPSHASTSTNIRDSYSSQTSFETADPSDPTPDDEDSDKQLSADENQLSPVAESPISNLRYPKIPRASNQLVPRSPVNSPRATNSPRHPPRRTQPSPPSTSHLLSNRRNDLPPLLLESRIPLKPTNAKDIAPVPTLKDPFTSPPRRTHARSNSSESWSIATPRSRPDRKSRTQSVASPDLYSTIAPLRVRRRADEMREINVGRDVQHNEVDEQGLKSPVWVPRLTPTRKGEDLFISVGWGGR